MVTTPLPDAMSDYEREEWARLQRHWDTKSKKRVVVPPRVKGALSRAGDTAGGAFAKASDIVPDAVKDLGDVVVEKSLGPTIKAATAFLELIEERVLEWTDPESVQAKHRAVGRDVQSLADIRALSLEDQDAVARRLRMRWRMIGATEGAAVGAVAFIPVGGWLGAVTIDLVVLHALNTAAATQAMYCYGIDARTPSEEEEVQRIVRRSLLDRAPAAATVRQSSRAWRAASHRVRWSEALRRDHQLMAAVERLVKLGGGKAAVTNVAKVMPAIGVFTNSGINSHVLATTAHNGVQYSKTRHLAKKYDLPMPTSLTRDALNPDD